MSRLILIQLVGFLLGSISMVNASDPSGSGSEVVASTRWESAAVAYSALEQFNGRWRGVGEGKWGTSSVEKLFATVLDGRITCRSGSSVYPVQERNPKGELHKAHSLMALVKSGSELTLTEYDNEGFIAHYVLDLISSAADESWIFELTGGENLPPKFRARLTLYAPRDEHYLETFELDFNEKGYVTYLTNKLSRDLQTPVSRGCYLE